MATTVPKIAVSGVEMALMNLVREYFYAIGEQKTSGGKEAIKKAFEAGLITKE